MFYQRHKSLIVILSAVFLFIYNLIPLSSFVYDWPENAAQYFPYFYKAEFLLVALLILFRYAKRFIVFFIILASVAACVQMTMPVALEAPRMHLIFWALYSLCWVAYIDLRKHHMGLIMSRRHPAQLFVIYAGFMAGAIGICFMATVSINHSWGDIGEVPAQIYSVVVGMAVIVPTLSIGVLKIIDMIGAEHFVALLIGAYYKPVERDRIVVFIDIAGSTSIAERLGPMRSTNLMARFIFDASGIFRIYGGDIINYTGDGLLTTWPRRQGDHALRAVLALRDRLNNSIAFYLREFGQTPDFRAGMHAGKVIISQVGEEKQFLALYGDPVNTAGRLERLNKELNTKLLVSSAVYSTMSKSCQILLVSRGMTSLKGKGDAIEIYTLKTEQDQKSA